jgi:hypothetical protein
MTIDWSKLLTSAQIERLKRTGSEIARLYALPDRWLAAELLRLARALRQEFPDQLSDPYAAAYEPSFVWHVVPETAKRLGAKVLLPNEAKLAEIVRLDGPEFRACVGIYLKHVSPHRWRPASDQAMPQPADILCHSIANGNPVAFAVDRLSPAPSHSEDREDWIARHVREISRARGFDETPYWSPGLQERPVREDCVEAPVREEFDEKAHRRTQSDMPEP